MGSRAIEPVVWSAGGRWLSALLLAVGCGGGEPEDGGGPRAEPQAAWPVASQAGRLEVITLLAP